METIRKLVGPTGLLLVCMLFAAAVSAFYERPIVTFNLPPMIIEMPRAVHANAANASDTNR